MTACLMLLIGYVYGIWNLCRLDAKEIEQNLEQIWEPLERAKEVFDFMVGPIIHPFEKIFKKVLGNLLESKKKDGSDNEGDDT
jgi:hypothetical protein